MHHRCLALINVPIQIFRLSTINVKMNKTTYIVQKTSIQNDNDSGNKKQIRSNVATGPVPHAKILNHFGYLENTFTHVNKFKNVFFKKVLLVRPESSSLSSPETS